MSLAILRKFGFAALLSMPLVACGGVEDASNAEQTNDAILDPNLYQIAFYDPCAYASADSYSWLYYQGQSEFVSSASYTGRSCNRFVADFIVTPDWQPGWNQFSWFNISTDAGAPSWMGQATCESYRQNTTIYKNAGGVGSYVKIGSYNLRGVWVGDSWGYCTSATTSGSGLPAISAPTGFDVYRVATSVRINGAYTTASASIGFQRRPS